MNGKTVIIADDHEIYRFGLEFLLNGLGMKVVAQASTGEELVDLAVKLKPELIITDYLMPGLSGLDAVHRIREKLRPRVLLLTNVESEDLQERCYQGDIHGYVFKSTAREELGHAVKQVLEGRTYYASLPDKHAAPRKLDQSPFSVLTPRETEIVALIAVGNTQQQIADQLGISLKTLEHHRTHINEKMGKKSIAELVRLAYTWGLVKDAGLASTYI